MHYKSDSESERYLQKLRAAQKETAERLLKELKKTEISEAEKFSAWQIRSLVLTEKDIKFLKDCGIDPEQ